MYQDWAWEAFQSITKVTHAPFGYSAVDGVLKDSGGNKTNNQESFWLAETLKYLYLIFDDPKKFSLDDWVFTTEAQPLRRGRKVQWTR